MWCGMAMRRGASVHLGLRVLTMVAQYAGVAGVSKYGRSFFFRYSPNMEPLHGVFAVKDGSSLVNILISIGNKVVRTQKIRIEN